MAVPRELVRAVEERWLNMKRGLIIFQKNPKLGQVKTRLAATVGNENALKIYHLLVQHTHKEVKQVNSKKYLFFSDEIDNDIRWLHYEKKVQNGNDLGERMYNALLEVKNEGIDCAVIIGTDCYELQHHHLENAFSVLDNNDYCIGPALDGGYYLIGTTSFDSEVFLGKEWSTENVFREAEKSISEMGKSLAVLPSLSDVDYEEDLKELAVYLNK